MIDEHESVDELKSPYARHKDISQGSFVAVFTQSHSLYSLRKTFATLALLRDGAVIHT